MNENNMVIENTSLFLDLNQAVRRLAERVMGYEHSEVLMVVLCQDAMPVANKIARRLGLNLMFTAVEADIDLTDAISGVNFDYSMVEESGRDIPRDFIYHQEQSLRSNLMSIYEETYNGARSKFPDKFIILVDELTNNGTKFLPSHTQNHSRESEENSSSMLELPPEQPFKRNRHFVFLHACSGYTGNEIKNHLDLIIKCKE
jgi:hypothetical protein